MCLGLSSALLQQQIPKRNTFLVTVHSKFSFLCCKASSETIWLQSAEERQSVHLEVGCSKCLRTIKLLNCLTAARLVFVFCERKFKNSNHHSIWWKKCERKFRALYMLRIPHKSAITFIIIVAVKIAQRTIVIGIQKDLPNPKFYLIRALLHGASVVSNFQRIST